ncbi:MAG: VWA domain-containing protein [Bacteroidota bacterium]|nr:VWA domain-containing protein [Bacteroidota bacterium]
MRRQTSNQLTKLGKSKKELIPAIRGLSEDTYFTIFVFENNVKSWRRSLVKATSANKNIAITYVNNLKSGGGTNIYGSLEKAFKLAGDVNNSSSVLGVETIFLLSDGAPSAGKITSQNELISEIEQWNSLDRVIINTIGLDNDQDKDFLSKLATNNRGVYIQK